MPKQFYQIDSEVDELQHIKNIAYITAIFKLKLKLKLLKLKTILTLIMSFSEISLNLMLYSKFISNNSFCKNKKYLITT